MYCILYCILCVYTWKIVKCPLKQTHAWDDSRHIRHPNHNLSIIYGARDFDPPDLVIISMLLAEDPILHAATALLATLLNETFGPRRGLLLASCFRRGFVSGKISV